MKFSTEDSKLCFMRSGSITERCRDNNSNTRKCKLDICCGECKNKNDCEESCIHEEEDD